VHAHKYALCLVCSHRCRSLCPFLSHYLNNERQKEIAEARAQKAHGKAKRTANNERQKEIAEARAQKALEEKDRLGARTEEQVASEIEERAQKVAEQKRAREEKLAEEIRKLVPGRAGAGRVRIQSDASLRAFQWAGNSR
jgi:L-lactate utilization protein LutC